LTSFSHVKPHAARGYAYIAAATFCWGLSAALGRAAFTGRLFASGSLPRIHPLILAQSRTTISLIVLAPILLLRGGQAKLKLPAADAARALVLGVLGVAASNYFYYAAIEKTNVATAIVIQYTAPVLVLLYMVARRLQRATFLRVGAVALSVVGCALAIGVVGGSRLLINPAGVAAAELAAFSFAFYNVYAHRLLLRHDRWPVLVYALLGAALFWMLINPPWRVVAQHYGWQQWVFLLVFALTSVLVPFSFYFAGLQHLDATRAIVTSCLEPVFSILIAAVALGELVRPMQAVGIVIVLVATVLVQLPGEPTDEVALLEPIE
jgi:drug/metabolite transporter, DME family